MVLESLLQPKCNPLPKTLLGNCSGRLLSRTLLCGRLHRDLCHNRKTGAVLLTPLSRMVTNRAMGNAPPRLQQYIHATAPTQDLQKESFFFRDIPWYEVKSRNALEMENEALATTSEISQQDHGGHFQLQFVTTVSVNIPSKAEQKRNQKIIRQTVMKNFRQQQKSEKLKPKVRSNRGLAAASNLNATGEEVETDALSTNTSLISSRSQSSSLSESDGNRDLGYKKSRKCSHAFQTRCVLGSPLTPLGAGRIDPFQPYSGDNNSSMHELIDHSITVVWPAFRPHGSSDEQPNIPAAWLLASNSRPVSMHSMLFGAQVHLDVLRGPQMNIDNPIRLYHKIQTIRLLKEELKHPEKIRLDEVILAILALSANEVETIANNIKEKIQSPFHSPLTSVQWLDVYGSISHIKAHVLAMRNLVDQKGGLEIIKLEGLAEVVAFSDILGATQTLSRPHWPLLERTLRFAPLELDDSVRFPLTKLGQSFSELRYFGLSEEMACIIQSMVDLTIVIDCHCRGTIPIQNFTTFIDRRNSVQHRLMSLPLGKELLDEEVSSICLYESIRHAAFIYSAAVTFPLPALSGHLHRLVSILQPLLESSKFDPCWRSCPKTLLWILVLGGIAALNTGERQWFVRNIAIVAKLLMVASWEEVVEVMEGFLWLDSACDAGGQVLWAEVAMGRLPHFVR